MTFEKATFGALGILVLATVFSVGISLYDSSGDIRPLVVMVVCGTAVVIVLFIFGFKEDYDDKMWEMAKEAVIEDRKSTSGTGNQDAKDIAKEIYTDTVTLCDEIKKELKEWKKK